MTELELQHVTIRHEGDVGYLVMDRPETNNALDLTMARELHQAALELSDDDSRCLVLTGTGGTFCTGADLTALSGDSGDHPTIKRLANYLHETVSTLARAPKPVVCGVNGVTAGGGIGPSLCGDIVIASESARFEFAYPRIGLSADGGSSYFLPRLVGLRTAQEIAFRDEPVSSQEAADLGLVTETVSDDGFDDAVREEAERLAAGPTRAYGETRALLRGSFDRSLDGQLAAEAERIARLTHTDDYRKGIEAFLSKEQADFEGE
ncbi:enoyl-CoA hydratase/isomerase family protein [Natronomonas sp. EA1]|uniref:enoyl-CoA hydratase/isomerase family protein n=1 Tax=Natronomonas sp. EA1 TaxID=3421655 RepID=UPI003EBFA7DE